MPSFTDQDSMDWRDVNYPPPVTTSEEESHSSSGQDHFSGVMDNSFFSTLPVGKSIPYQSPEEYELKGPFAYRPTIPPMGRISGKEEGRDNKLFVVDRKDDILRAVALSSGAKMMTSTMAPATAAPVSSKESMTNTGVTSPLNLASKNVSDQRSPLYTQSGLPAMMTPLNPSVASVSAPKPSTLTMSAVQTFIRIFPLSVQSPSESSAAQLSRLQVARSQAMKTCMGQGISTEVIPAPLMTSGMYSSACLPQTEGQQYRMEPAGGMTTRPEAKRSTIREEDDEEGDHHRPDSKRMKTGKVGNEMEVQRAGISTGNIDILKPATSSMASLIRMPEQRNLVGYSSGSDEGPRNGVPIDPGSLKTLIFESPVKETSSVKISSETREPTKPTVDYASHNVGMSASALIDEIIARGVRESPTSNASRSVYTNNDDVIKSGDSLRTRYEEADTLPTQYSKFEPKSSHFPQESRIYPGGSHRISNLETTSPPRGSEIVNPSSRFGGLPTVFESDERKGGGYLESKKIPSNYSSPPFNRLSQGKRARRSFDSSVSNPGTGSSIGYGSGYSDGLMKSGGEGRSRSSDRSSSKYMNLRNKNNRRPVQGGGRVRQKRQTARDMVRPLKQWLYSHRDVPYPTRADKLELASRSNMSLTQVSNWFANARRRLKNTVQEVDSNGQPLSWAKRMKLYNSHVVGNQELLSISSDDSSCSSEYSNWRDKQLAADEEFQDDGNVKLELDSGGKIRGFYTPDRRSLDSSILAGMDGFMPQGLGGGASKFKQGILHRYLNDSYDELMRRHGDVTDDVDRRRNASGSLSSHDYEEEVEGEEEEEGRDGAESVSSTNTVTASKRNADGKEKQVEFAETLETEGLEALECQRSKLAEDLHWKEISAAMALTTLARSKPAI